MNRYIGTYTDLKWPSNLRRQPGRKKTVPSVSFYRKTPSLKGKFISSAAVVGLNFRDHSTFLPSIILTVKMRSALRITIATGKNPSNSTRSRYENLNFVGAQTCNIIKAHPRANDGVPYVYNTGRYRLILIVVQ